MKKRHLVRSALFVLCLFIALTIFIVAMIGAAAFAGTIELPRTGQTICYDLYGNYPFACTGTGQDGDILAGVPWPTSRFSIIYCESAQACADQTSDCDSNPGTDVVIDNLTGLMWPRTGSSARGKLTWSMAVSVPATWTFCGQSGWRLPNVNEFESLIHAGESNTASWLMSQGFTYADSSGHWTSTRYAGDTNYAWTITLQSGIASPVIADNTISQYAMLVRTAQTGAVQLPQTGQKTIYATGDDGDLQAGAPWPDPRFIDNQNGTLTDNLTGLIWLKQGTGCFNSENWSEALSDTKNLKNGTCGLTDGSQAGDWRLPNRNELMSLVDRSGYNPALPVGFPASYNPVWTSTTYSNASNNAWRVNLGTGAVAVEVKTDSTLAFVWPVRGGVSSDTTPPVISGMPSNITAEATSSAGAIVTYTLPTATDAVDGSVMVTCTPGPGSTFPLGGTTVSCSAGDKAGNTASSSFTVTTVDTTAPVITLPSNITVQAGSSAGIAIAYSVTATDMVSGFVTPSCAPSSGTTFPLGTTTVVCSAADGAGNTATSSFTISVWNMTPDSFIFTGQSGLARNTLATSNTVTVWGINVPAPLTVSNGSYSLNGAPFTSIAGFANNGDTVQVQQLSSAAYETRTDAVLTIGGVSGTFSVTTKANTPPTAHAGMNQTVHAGILVSLDGSGSSDPDADPITYAWTIVSKPYGSTAALSDPGAVKPTFIPDRTGEYILELAVTDSFGAASTPAQAVISTTNTAPIADAGPDQAVIVIGSAIQLDGSRSWDADGDLITYAWTFTSIPPGSTAVLTNSSSSLPSFVADVNGTYALQLVVNDPWAQSAPATVLVSFTNVKPLANAGSSQSVVVGDTVVLNGSGSTDANGDPLSYLWSFTSAPAGSQATIASPTALSPTFVPDLPGLYVIQLIVNDGQVNSEPATVQVQVIGRETEAINTARNIETVITSLDGVLFKNPNMKNALINKLNAVIANIGEGNYNGALAQLETDVLGKTDGCANNGAPDKNDWITTCGGQSLVHPAVLDTIDIVKSLM